MNKQRSEHLLALSKISSMYHRVHYGSVIFYGIHNTC